MWTFQQFYMGDPKNKKNCIIARQPNWLHTFRDFSRCAHYLASMGSDKENFVVSWVQIYGKMKPNKTFCVYVLQFFNFMVKLLRLYGIWDPCIPWIHVSKSHANYSKNLWSVCNNWTGPTSEKHGVICPETIVLGFPTSKPEKIHTSLKALTLWMSWFVVVDHYA